MRDKNDVFQESVVFHRGFPAFSATATLGITTVRKPAGFLIERVELISDAAYAADAANYYALTLQHGSGNVSSATWSTLTGANGAFTAGVPVDMTLSATPGGLLVPNLDTISLLGTKHASAANLTLLVNIFGRYL